ncbi:hypothetical protein HEK616_22130 [Streptomyces nigrescens]|uniref:Lipoprotein n=2 Tax=Streptomyces TaxID=1883 RepID=A0ABN6QVT0_STRNI|nr:hypothetical protein [Streptomyces nigrescens]MEE4419844.1 hypothetical protein [Streptomyces sp. DSM 41528]BDM68726.1 hypothetical protein HEK616_22130 [Streptomyces nigrescens]
MRRLIAVPTVLLALTAAGCADGDDGGTRSSSTGPGPRRTGEGSPAVPGQPVSCGRLQDALGQEGDVALYADPTAAGTVPCTEARDVMTEFFLRAPREAGDDRGTLSVRGWFCHYESGPTGTWISACSKNKREMHTEEADDQGTGPDAPGGPDEPDAPDGSQLPPLPGDPSAPMDDPSTEEL